MSSPESDESWSDSGSSMTTPASSPFFGPVDLNPSIRSICVIGGGYVGGPTAAVLALHNPQIRVTVVDRDSTRISAWQSAHLPVHEPNLLPIVRVSRDTPFTETGYRKPNLFFTTDTARSLASADMIFLAVNTPTKTFGIGAGRATDMTAVDDAVAQIARYARPGAIIVEKSTVPCGTAQRVRAALDLDHRRDRFEVLSNPEFLAEGSAIENLNVPDRVLIGCADTAAGHRAAQLLSDVYRAWVPSDRILRINAWSAELAKLAANAMLAQRISSINAISAICERAGPGASGGSGGGSNTCSADTDKGAQVNEVAQAIGLDPRIGPQFLKAGLGFGGSCFRKDVASLTYLAESLGLDDVADYWRQVNVMNERQRDRFARRVITQFGGNLVSKKITLLGFAFKKNTGDPRESLAVDVIRVLGEERPGEIAIFDPFCRECDILREVRAVSTASVRVYSDPYLACEMAHAVLVVTDCDQFRVSKPSGIDQNLDALASPALTSPVLDAKQPDTVLSQALNAGLHVSPTSTGIDQTLNAILASSALASPVLDAKPGIDQTLNAALTSPALDVKSGTGKKVHTAEKEINGRTYYFKPLHCPPGCSACSHKPIHMDPLDWTRVAYNMREPKWVLDGRGILDLKALNRLGLRVDAVGRS